MIRFFYVIIRNLYKLPFILHRLRKIIRHPDIYSEEDAYEAVRDVMRMIKRTGHITTQVDGLENLPDEGGYVMYPNHQGKYDVLGIMCAHDAPCTFVMDEDKSEGILVKEIVDVLGAMRMSVTDVRSGIRVMGQVTRELISGRRYIIFSEGGYKRNRNDVMEFKSGSFKCAMKAGVPIVPVALIDSYKPFNSLRLGRVTTYVHFLTPITSADYLGKTTREVSQMVRTAIIDKISES